MYRIDRRSYWLALAGFGSVFAALWVFLSWPPQIGVVVMLLGIYRLHDLGRTGSWMVVLFIPAIFAQQVFVSGRGEAFAGGQVVEIVSALLTAGAIILLGFFPGQPGANAYGAPPRLSR